MPVHLRFGRATKHKSARELATRVNAALQQLRETKSDRVREKAMEDVSRNLEQIKVLLLGIDDQVPNKEDAMQLNQGVIEHDLMTHLVMQLKAFDFETRKDIGLMTGALLRLTDEERCPMADYFAEREVIVQSLMNRYNDHTDPHIGLIAGGMLRDCIRHEKLARMIASSGMLLQFFHDIEDTKFEIAADALATFREVIVRHKSMIGEVLDRRFEEFFPRMNDLIKSGDFFIRQQTLKLLSEILVEPENHNVAVKYVQDVQNLMMLMNLLRDKYVSIQFEAFHSFKVFLVGDDKAPEVLDILQKNKEKLLQFFQNFQRDKAEEEESFREEIEYVCTLIQQIPSINST